MTIVLIVLGCCLMIAVLFAVALAGAGPSSEHNAEAEAAVLADLAAFESPSGKTFFPDADSALELVETLKEVTEEDHRRPGA